MQQWLFQTPSELVQREDNMIPFQQVQTMFTINLLFTLLTLAEKVEFVRAPSNKAIFLFLVCDMKT